MGPVTCIPCEKLHSFHVLYSQWIHAGNTYIKECILHFLLYHQFSLLLYVYDTFILLVNVKKMLSFLYQVCYTIFMVDTILGRGALNINRVVIQTAEFTVIYVST